MKRSEMIKEAERLASDRDLCVPGDGYNIEVYHLAEKFLDIFEELGMRVPVTGSLKSQIAAVHNDWELEDE